MALARTVSPSFSSSVFRCLYFRILPGRLAGNPNCHSCFPCSSVVVVLVSEARPEPPTGGHSKDQTTSTGTVIFRSFVLFRPWITGEHRRGICAFECVTAHVRGFEEDSRSEVVFWIDELSIEFGCHCFIVEEHVLLSALQHIFASHLLREALRPRLCLPNSLS